MMQQPDQFFDTIRRTLFAPELTQDEVDGCNAILAAMEGSPLAFTAYALATAYHETASTMQPIKEYGGDSYFTRMYDIQGARPQLAMTNGNTKPGDGAKYCGRGYVQLTWKNNYELAGEACNADLVGNPDLALDPTIAAKILNQGMTDGWFTGKKFADYLPASGSASIQQFALARFIINGTDCAVKIAQHAMVFQQALIAGQWQ